MDAKATLKIELKSLNELHVCLHRSCILRLHEIFTHVTKMTNWRASCWMTNGCPQACLCGSRMELHLPHKKESATPCHHGLSQLWMRGIWGNFWHHPNVELFVVHLYGHIFATKPVDSHLHQHILFSLLL